MKILISFSIPVFNEAPNIGPLYKRLIDVCDGLSDEYEFEFVFTDNRSTDETWPLLRQLADRDPRVKAARFGSNIGYQRSLLANYALTKGQAVLQLDADLQDPPELLPQFLKHWREGYQDVVGIRSQRSEGKAIGVMRRFGYWFLNLVSETNMTRDAGDFRLLDRRIVDALVKSRSPNPYIRGMISSFGYRQLGVPYKRDARLAGKSNFGLWRILQLGMQGLLNHSTAPLRLATVLGVAMLIVSALFACVLTLQKILDPTIAQGWTSLSVLIWFGIGLVCFLLGVIGEYILRIYMILRQNDVTPITDELGLN